MSVPTVKLNSGIDFPCLALGTWLAKEPTKLRNAVKIAIECGYRVIDCAYIYQNEEIIGEVIKETIESGKCKREDLFIISKVWCTYHSEQLVYENVEQMLKNLQIDYLDACLIHWPVGLKEGTGELFPKDEKENFLFSDVDYIETYKALEKLTKDGKIRHPGLSNFNIEQIERIKQNCSITPAINQFECHAYLNQKKLIEYCIQNNIRPMAYAPLGSPTRPWKDDGKEPVLMEDPVIKVIATKYGVQPAQVLVQFLLKRGLIVAVKSVTEQRVKDNFKSINVNLSDEDMEQIYSINKDFRMFLIPHYKGSKYHPFQDELPA